MRIWDLRALFLRSCTEKTVPFLLLVGSLVRVASEEKVDTEAVSMSVAFFSARASALCWRALWRMPWVMVMAERRSTKLLDTPNWERPPEDILMEYLVVELLER